MIRRLEDQKSNMQGDQKNIRTENLKIRRPETNRTEEHNTTIP